MVQEAFPFPSPPPPMPPARRGSTRGARRNQKLSPDGGATPAPRREGDLLAMNAAYNQGLYFDGDIDIPLIDWRHYLEEELDMHNSHQSFASRQRMLRPRRRRLQPGDLVHGRAPVARSSTRRRRRSR